MDRANYGNFAESTMSKTIPEIPVGACVECGQFKCCCFDDMQPADDDDLCGDCGETWRNCECDQYDVIGVTTYGVDGIANGYEPFPTAKSSRLR